MTHRHLPASVESCHWGYFDAALPPVLTIADGDSMSIETVSGGPDCLPPAGFPVPEALRDIHARAERMLPGQILTGPIAVEGAEPGCVLEVRIDAVELATDWGWNLIRPLSGTLPDDFSERRHLTIPLDRTATTARLPWSLDLPLRPFFGVIGTAPPPA